MKRTVCLAADWQVCGFAPEAFDAGRFWAGELDGRWLSATMPCDVHTLLMHHGLLADPALGAGDGESAWVERWVWAYRTTFSLTAEDLAAAGRELCFYGLDTYADIYLNGVLLAHTENMLVEHVVDLGAAARAGENQLTVLFAPFAAASLQKPLPEDFWINYAPERAYARKAGYQVGWDWTPRVCTVGVWRPVELRVWTGGVLDGVQVQTLALEKENTAARLRLTAQARTGESPLRLRYTVLDGQKPVAALETGEAECRLELERPQLWWTHDLGEAHLYTLRAELLDGGGAVQDVLEQEFGVRTLDVCTRDEASGQARFVMRLNGVPLFARGANWVPLSNRPGALTAADYDAMLRRARDANMNTLCLWGGGIYEHDAFYRFCDREGLLVWQYFMFACGEYPDFDADFVSNVEDEVEKAVRRLSSHPCIALWVGNVESQMLCDKIGLDRPMYGKRLFETLIPSWLARLDPTRPYLPSSPWGGPTPNSMEAGDRHNWDVWFNDIPYTDYTQDTTCFASEFGLHASPSLEAIRQTTGEEDPALDSFAVRYMNRDQSLSRMEYYLDAYTGRPADLRGYIADTMLIQALALQCACGHYRHRWPTCGGALVWQLNDCCGAHSWSVVDSLGIPKAAWYYLRQSFAPVAVYLEEVDAVVTRVWAMNHGPAARAVRLDLELGDFLGHRAYAEVLDLTLDAGEVRCVKTVRAGGRFVPNVALANRPRLYYLAARLDGEERPTVRFFERPKDLLLPPAPLEVQWQRDRVTVSCPVFAQFVHLEGALAGFAIEDNYFDLLPGQRRTLCFTDEEALGPAARALRWTARNPAR